MNSDTAIKLTFEEFYRILEILEFVSHNQTIYDEDIKHLVKKISSQLPQHFIVNSQNNLDLRILGSGN